MDDGVALVQMYATFFILGQIGAGLLAGLVLVVSEWVTLFGTGRHRRSFHCARAGREVEVEFADRRVFGWPRPTRVLRCCAFETPTTIECGGRCLDSAFRRQWPFALPVMGRTAVGLRQIV